MSGGWQWCHFFGRVHNSREARLRHCPSATLGGILRSQSTDTEVELTEGMNLDKAGTTGVTSPRLNG